MKGGFTILLMVVGTLWASVAVSGDSASLPVYKTGDTWRIAYESHGRNVDSSDVLSNGTYELVYGENGEILVYAVDGGKRELYASLDELRQALFVVLPNPIDAKEKVPNFKFPLVVGKTWKGRYYYRRGWVNAKVKVAAVENVTVPAGTILTFKIEREDEPSQLSKKSVYYYSPQTKTVVKFSNEYSSGPTFGFVLLNYKVHQER